jgi:hypothetical protein
VTALTAYLPRGAVSKASPGLFARIKEADSEFGDGLHKLTQQCSLFLRFDECFGVLFGATNSSKLN